MMSDNGSSAVPHFIIAGGFVVILNWFLISGEKKKSFSGPWLA